MVTEDWFLAFLAAIYGVKISTLACCRAFGSAEFLGRGMVQEVLERDRQMKNRCYDDIKSGLWGPQCKSSVTAKKNCALRCFCPECYELVYENDPLGEGETDYVRSLEYELCLYKLFAGETLEGVRGAFDC